MNKKEKTTKRERASVAAMVLLAAALIAYLCGIVVFGDRFLPGTTINGVDCGLRTAEDVIEDIRAESDSIKLKIVFRDGGSKSVTGKAIGYECTSPDDITGIIEEQDEYMWPVSLVRGTGYAVQGKYKYDKEKVSKMIEATPQMIAVNMEEPQDAYIEYSEEAGEFVIMPETDGTKIDMDAFMKTLDEYLSKNGDVLTREDIIVNILEEDVYETANVKADSEELNAEKDRLNRLTSGEIIYDLPSGEKVVLNRSVCKDWLETDDNGKYVYDEDLWDENVTAFIDEIAVKTNTVWDSRTFESTWDGEITVPGGTYGYSVDKESEAEDIYGIIGSGETVEREPFYYSEEIGDPDTNDGIGDTYIEVSIEDQHLWYYEDGECIMESDVVTGNNGNHDTPRGVYQVLYAQRNAVLKGRIMSNGKPEYETPVSYWMPFYDGCGFHDAGWRGRFGGSVYKGNGSHGCVNMPPAKARELFGYVDSGTVAVIY